MTTGSILTNQPENRSEPAADAGSTRNPRIGEMLLDLGIITRAQLEEALAEQARHGGRLGEILFALTHHERMEIAETLARQLGVEWVRPDRLEIPAEVLGAITARMAGHYQIIPLRLTEDTLVIASVEPQASERIDEIELLTGRRIRCALAMSVHLREAIKKHYGVGAETIEKIDAAEDEGLVLEEDGLSIDEETGDASIIRFVNQVIAEAYRLAATDIHFEPEENTFRIRYRIDGMLEEIPIPAQIKKFQATIISRLKVMARLDIAEQRLPQDGRIHVKIAHESFDLRVSVLPTPYGEAINLRLLRRANVHFSLEDLGYSRDNLSLLTHMAQLPNGMILVTGPTGSGKTTTLYALLQKINLPDRKIITVEDPIEYHLPGMIQMQVHESIGFTFARALRSILRHDPDIVLVGEIRDPETAEIAIRMAMTGHLVFSTLHTNDAASTIARLIDMGQESYLLASTILCVVAQRLIRLLCPHCRAVYTPEAALLDPFRQMGAPMPEQFFRARGCERCRRSGYLGRTGIHELYPMDEGFRSLVMARAPASQFRELARRKAIRLMHEDGWERVLAGRTTVEEILRVTQAAEV